MFGNRYVGSTTAKRNGFSVLGPEVTVTGDIEADSDLHIDGTVAGDLACASLIPTERGRITGAVRARSARIAGPIEGCVAVDDLPIDARPRLLGATAHVRKSATEGK